MNQHFDNEPRTDRHASPSTCAIGALAPRPTRHQRPTTKTRRAPRAVHDRYCPACRGLREEHSLAILEHSVRTGRMAPRASSTGGQRLSRAVLEEAIADFKRGICSVCATSQERYECQDAYRWFNSTDTDWPLSFENVCYRLECDPASVRDTIRRVKRAAVVAGCA